MGLFDPEPSLRKTVICVHLSGIRVRNVRSSHYFGGWFFQFSICLDASRAITFTIWLSLSPLQNSNCPRPPPRLYESANCFVLSKSSLHSSNLNFSTQLCPPPVAPIKST